MHCRGCILYALARVQIGGAAAGARLERMHAGPNFNDGRFVNALPTNTVSPDKLIETARIYLEPAERKPRKPGNV